MPVEEVLAIPFSGQERAASLCPGGRQGGGGWGKEAAAPAQALSLPQRHLQSPLVPLGPSGHQGGTVLLLGR